MMKFKYDGFMTMDMLDETYRRLPMEEKQKFEIQMQEVSRITRHDSLAQQLVFEEGMKRGFILSHMERL